MKRQFWSIALAAVALLVGCDRDAKTATKAVATTQLAPTTQADESPQTSPTTSDSDDAKVASAPQPAAASFIVRDGQNDRIYDFPRARLRLTQDGDKYTAVLYSDDPKAAINSDYKGNSFFLEMKLDIDDPAKFIRADWVHKELSSDPEETVDGIFLDGTHLHLQPAEAMATFDGTGKTVQVAVWGQFFKFESNQVNRTPTRVAVRGEFSATVEVKK